MGNLIMNEFFPIAAIVSDYDRTLTDMSLALYLPATAILRLLRETYQIRIIVASGRQMNFLIDELGELELIDAFIGENGAVIYLPLTGVKALLDHEDLRIKESLRAHDIPFEEGEVILSVKRDFETAVKRIVAEKKYPIEFHYNVDSVMLLPPGINKARGVKEALNRLGTQSGRLICIGDAENDLSLFEIADIRVATEDALSVVKRKADIVCRGEGGAGVSRFLRSLLTAMEGSRSMQRRR